MKALRREDGSITLFRPDMNAKRMAMGAERLCIPPVPEDIFVNAVISTIQANSQWVPPYGQGCLYLRYARNHAP